MGFFDTAREKIREHFDKNRQDREKMEGLRKEVDLQRQQIFEEQFKKDSLEVVKRQAYREAAEKSGMQKLRAETRLRRLNESSSTPEPGTWREKMRDYTAKNIARRQENLQRTVEIRAKAEEIKQERMQQRGKPINQNSPRTIRFNRPTWKM